ncbi:hypothetical protein ACWC24_33630 [Streptomyces sp. NPDC001443]
MPALVAGAPLSSELHRHAGAAVRLLDWDAASDLLSGDSGDGMVSLLWSGKIGEWAFCVEKEGGIGFGEEALIAHNGGEVGMAPVVALVLDHLGITLDGATLAGPRPSVTLAENDAPPGSLRDTSAGEGPVPPGTVEIL